MKKKVELAICMGSSCFFRGNNQTLKAIKEFLKEEGAEEKVHLQGRLCQGKCGCGPNMELNGESCSGLSTAGALDRIAFALENAEKNEE